MQLVGHSFDLGKGFKPAIAGLVIFTITIISRAFFEITIPMVLTLDLIFMTGCALYNPINNAIVYNASAKSENSSYFQYLAEGAWDIGGILSTTFTAFALTYFHFPLPYYLLFGIIGVVASGYAVKTELKKLED